MQQVRAHVQGMERGEDIHDVMGMLWTELHRAGIRFNYMSICVGEEGEDFVHIYALYATGFRDWLASLEFRPFKTDIAPGADLHYLQVPRSTWEEYHTEFTGIRYHRGDVFREQQERVSHLWGRTMPLQHAEGDEGSMESIAVPLPQGRLYLADIEIPSAEPTFTPHDLATVEGFAEALGLGFTRYFDFQRLEQRNRELEIESAVERVQNAVHGMKTSADIVPVILLLSGELLHLGLDYNFCSIALVDRDANRARIYGTAGSLNRPSDFFQAMGPLIYPENTLDSFGPEAIAQLENEDGPVFLSNIPGFEDYTASYTSASLDSYHGRAQQIDRTTILSRTDAEMETIVPQIAAQWKYRGDFLREHWPRSVLRTPFSGGTIALSHGRPDFYSEEDARILERFAEAFSLGYARHLDFRKLERQNRALEEANARLADANEQIREATRRKSEFLRRMSHDLRTPMNAIIGYTRILLRKARGKLDDRQLRNLGNIDASAHNLLNLINEILDLSQVEAGRIEVKPQEVDLKQLADECADAVASLVGAGVELVREIEAVPVVRTDREIVRKVLMNLLSNAVKFTEEGRIAVKVRSVEGQVELSVADTGIGIPAADLPYIFEEFCQVERQGSTEVEGTGLGLAIAKKSVELLGGTLGAESEVGVGTTFTLKIKDYEV